jgi:hypothetical protein
MSAIRYFLPIFFLVCTSGAFGSAIAPSFTAEVQHVAASVPESDAPVSPVFEAAVDTGMDAIASSGSYHVSDGLPSAGLACGGFHGLVYFLTVLESPFPPAVPQESKLKPA